MILCVFVAVYFDLLQGVSKNEYSLFFIYLKKKSGAEWGKNHFITVVFIFIEDPAAYQFLQRAMASPENH